MNDYYDEDGRWEPVGWSFHLKWGLAWVVVVGGAALIWWGVV